MNPLSITAFCSSINLMFFLFFSVQVANASECSNSLICSEFSHARQVFIGRASEVTVENDKGFGKIVVNFTVIEKLKGKVNETEIVRFSLVETGPRFEVGEQYLVYSDDSPVNGICNRTDRLVRRQRDLDYIRKLDPLKPSFTGHLWIRGLDSSALQQMTVSVLDGSSTTTLPSTEYGVYKAELKHRGVYRFSISFPFDVETTWQGDAIVQQRSPKDLAFDFVYQPNECGSVIIDAVVKAPDEVASISGILVDSNGAPVPRMSVRLYPKRLDQDFRLLDYQVTKSDEFGRYVFLDVEPGSYVLGFNVGESPKLDLPFESTFFPGVVTSGTTKFVDVVAGTAIQLEPYNLGKRLMPITFKGRVVLKQQRSATQSPETLDLAVKIYLRVLDPKTMLPALGFDPSGKVPINVYQDGRFSFVGFPNQPYKIEASAVGLDGTKYKTELVAIPVGPNQSSIVIHLVPDRI